MRRRQRARLYGIAYEKREVTDTGNGFFLG